MLHNIALTLQVNQFTCPVVEITHDDLCAASSGTRWTLIVGEDGYDELQVLARAPLADGSDGVLVMCRRKCMGDIGTFDVYQLYNTVTQEWQMEEK